MATNYPTGLDTFATIGASDEMDDEVGTRTHREMHNDANDAIEAIQGELGLSPSGAAATVAARLGTFSALYTTDNYPTYADVPNPNDGDRFLYLGTAVLWQRRSGTWITEGTIGADVRAAQWFISGIGGVTDYTDVASPVEGDCFLYPGSGDIFRYTSSAWAYGGAI